MQKESRTRVEKEEKSGRPSSMRFGAVSGPASARAVNVFHPRFFLPELFLGSGENHRGRPTLLGVRDPDIASFPFLPVCFRSRGSERTAAL